MTPLRRKYTCKDCGGEITFVAWVTDHRTGQRRYAKSYGLKAFPLCNSCSGGKQ